MPYVIRLAKRYSVSWGRDEQTVFSFIHERIGGAGGFPDGGDESVARSEGFEEHAKPKSEIKRNSKSD